MISSTDDVLEWNPTAWLRTFAKMSSSMPTSYSTAGAARHEPLLAPSLLASDLANIQATAELLSTAEADWLHFDVMDGRFVPNLSFGLPVLEALRPHARQPIDVHLMIEEPERYLTAFREAGATNITVHYEACRHLHRVVEQIRSLGCTAGVALNPATPILLLQDIITELDVVLVMSVNPGFGGQSFIPHTLQKVADLKAMLVDTGSAALIEVDGGVTQANAGPLVEAGADVLVAGSFVFKSPGGPVAALAGLRSQLRGAGQEKDKKAKK